MIPDIQGKTSAADAAGSSKSLGTARKGADDRAGGFSDALYEADRDALPKKTEEAAEDSLEQTSAGDQPNSAKPVKPKPIIDISQQSLRRPLQGLNGADQAAHVKIPSEVGKSGQVAERQLTPAEKKLKEALLVAKAIAEKSDALHGKKTSETETDPDAVQGADEIDIDALMADDGHDAEISDVLSLLNHHSDKAVAEAGFNPARGNGSSDKRKQTDDGSEHSSIDKVRADKDTAHKDLFATSSDPLAMPADLEGESSGDRLFRFTGAKSSSQSLDMAISGGKGERSVEMRSSGNGAAENVTVLDSRRFLGLAPNSNSAALTAALSGDSEWVAAMQPGSALSNAAAQSSTGSVVNTLKLEMNPHSLGSVTAMLRLQGETLNVHLTVETRAAYRQLSEDSGGIVDALRSQGFAVDQVTISIAPTADSDSTAAQQSGQGGQQASANDERQGSAAGRGQGNGNGRQNTSENVRNVSENPAGQPEATISGSARPNQLYL
jgi:chemotaxis protein MotD